MTNRNAAEFAILLLSGSLSLGIASGPKKFAVAVAPANVPLAASQSQSFTATVIGAVDSAVTWSLSPMVGSISSSGVYTAPASVSAAQTVIVTATSVANSTITGSASLLLVPTISISLNPPTTALLPSQLQTLIATVNGASNTGVTWEVSPPLGSYISTSTTATYLAPSAAPSTQTVTITATSMADSTKSAAAVLTLLQAVTVAVSPSTVTLAPSQSQQFTAAVSGANNPAVIWSVIPPVGSISTTGFYSAPAAIPAAQTVTIKAQSVAAPAKSATSTVSLQPAAQVRFTIDANGLASLAYAGQSFYLPRPYFEVGNVIFRSPAGVEKNAGWALPTSILLQTTDSVQHIYGAGHPDSFTLKIAWSTPDNHTLRVDTQVTNNDAADSLARIDLALLNLQIPSPALQFNGNIPISIGQPADSLPVGFLSNTWGSLAFWLDDYSKTTTLGSPYANGQTQFNFWLENYAQRPYGTATKYYETDIPPGATQQLTYFVSFGSPSDTPATLAPEGFTQYRLAFPNLLQWTDRRPIGNWFISQGTTTSATNPRGYLWNSALDASNPTAFSTAVLAKADDVLSRMNKITPHPQGIVIWDLEGQEFFQYFTYVGHPDKLPQISPEMDAVADQLFAKFRNAGYLVGLTLRPNDFQTGNTPPSTCQSGAQVGQRDVFIKVNAAFPYRGFECSQTNTWSQDGPQQPYFQTIFDDDAAILANLSQKVAYAHNRWNARLFYVDSNVYLTTGGAVTANIFRSLMQQFPDCLFMPEWKNAFYTGATAPYAQPNMGISYTPSSWKWLYLSAFSLINLSAADLVAQYNDLLQGVQSGDIMLFRAWYDSPEIPVMQQLYAVAPQAK